MATIQSRIQLVDSMSGPMMNIIRGLDTMMNSFDNIDESIRDSFDPEVITSARRDFDLANRELVEMRNNINNAGNQQEQFTREVQQSENAMNGLAGKVIGVMGAYVGFSAVKDVGSEMYDATLQLEATEAKYETVFAGMTDEAQTFIDDFQKLTPASEAATRSMASGIQDLLVPMGFARAEATEMTGETMHLMGALTNFNSATQTAETVADKFSAALTGEYDGLKALGIQVDADIVRQRAVAMGLASTTGEMSKQAQAQALLDLAYEQSGDALAAYNEESLDTLTRQNILKESFTDTFAEAGQSLLPKINEFLIKIQEHMPEIKTGIYAFSYAFGVAVDMAGMLLDGVMNVARFVIDNWSFIEPIIMGIVFALGLYLMYMGITTAITVGSTIAQGLHAAAIFLTTNATWAQAGAQAGLNTAMYACPIVWIVAIIGILIALIYGAVAAINHFAGTSISATGLIFGAVAFLIANIWNRFLALLEFLLGIIEYLINNFINFANFVGNVFENPVSSVIYLFSGMADNILGVIEKIASAMDFVFGSNMADTVAGWRAGISDMADAAVEKYAPDENYQKIMEEVSLSVDGLGLGRWDPSDAMNSGYNLGKGFDDKMSGLFDGGAPSIDELMKKSLGGDGSSAYDSASDQNGYLSDIATNIGDISDTLSASKEDMEEMKNLAEREAINRFTTAEIKVDMGGITQHVNSNADLDGIVTYLTKGVTEAMDRSAKGVYA